MKTGGPNRPSNPEDGNVFRVGKEKELVAQFGPGTMCFESFMGKIERKVKYFKQWSDNTITWEYDEDSE